MNTIEIELRYEVLDRENIAAFVAPFELLHKKHDIDLYFDTVDGLHDRRGLYLRVRNDQKFDIKFNRACLEDPNLPRQDFCEEHNFVLPFQQADLMRFNNLVQSVGLSSIEHPSFEEFTMANNLLVFYTVDKVRTSYRYGGFTLAVDEVKELGNFLEIELMAKDTDNLEMVKQQMQLLVAGLKVRPSLAGYATLLMRKNNFEQYLKSRSVLEADRHLVRPLQ